MLFPVHLISRARPLLPRLLAALVFVLSIFCGGCATAPHAPTSPVVQAGELLREAGKPHLGDSAHAIGRYLDAARAALPIVLDPHAAPADRERAKQIYNTATAACAVMLKASAAFPEGAAFATFPGQGTTYHLRVRSGDSASANPANFDRLIDASKIRRQHLASDVVRPGLGGALVGLITSPRNVPHRPQRGFALSLTAVLDFHPASRQGGTVVDLSLFNARDREEITFDGRPFPLKGDFSAALALYPKLGFVHGIRAMLLSDHTADSEGVYFLQPFDPRKIPVLFIQGFMSSPHAWLDSVNDLDRDPDFRRRYQVWAVIYPSGAPIAVSAMHLRDELAGIARAYPQKQKLVIVGYSMGGLLARMQVVNTGRTLWDTIFGAKADQLYASQPASSLLKRTLIFHSNPRVSRVIFIATPHRGSGFADLRISSIAGSLIRMPATLIHDFTPQMRSILTGANPEVRTIPTSLLGMSPKSPLLKGLDQLPLQVPYYSIIGNRGKDHQPLAESSDGVVPYSSSHLDGAQSELIVPTSHDAHRSPASVAEVLRILSLPN